MIEVRALDESDILYLVKGLEEFEKDKAIKAGLRAAVNVFKVKGRGNLKNRLKHHGRGTGHLMNSFTSRVKKNKLGALSGFERPGGNHAHLVDMGTKRRVTKGKGKFPSGVNRGVMPANYFWKDAKNSEESKAINKCYEGVRMAVQRINERR